MQWAGAFLAVPSLHISQRKFIFPFQTFIFREKTELDAKAFSERYKSFRVCSVGGCAQQAVGRQSGVASNGNQDSAR